MKIIKKRINRRHLRVSRRRNSKRRNDVYESKPKFHQAFMTWFRQARHRIAIPLTIRQKNAHFIRLSFDHYPSELNIWLLNGEMSVSVDWNGIFIDYLVCIDCLMPTYYPGTNGKKFIGSYTAVAHELQIRYATLNQFWIDQVFEQFAKWVNERVAPAGWLTLHEVDGGGITWARLHKELPKKQGGVICIFPLPVNSISSKPAAASISADK